jgi:hypothetical protein
MLDKLIKIQRSGNGRTSSLSTPRTRSQGPEYKTIKINTV